jgi:hypothetical protein
VVAFRGFCEFSVSGQAHFLLSHTAHPMLCLLNEARIVAKSSCDKGNAIECSKGLIEKGKV